MAKTNLFRRQFAKLASKLLVLSICLALLVPQLVLADNVNWKEKESKHFVVYFEKASEGERILKKAEGFYSQMTSDYNYRVPRRISIYVYHDHSTFLAQSPTGINRAYSQPFMNRIFISATRKSVDVAIAHELCHVIFLQSLPDSSKVPFWFIEGIAIYQAELSAGSDGGTPYSLQGEAHSISALSQKVPKDVKEQQSIAAEGYLMVQYFADKYGRDKLNRLIKNLQNGMDFSGALEKSLGVTEEELDKAWQMYITARSRQVYVQSLQYFGILIMSLLVVIATGIWFRKRKQRMEELQDDTEDIQPESLDSS